MSELAPSHGAVVGGPLVLLRLEGFVLLVGALAGFATTGRPWWLVPALLLLPDVVLAGYARSNRLGALLYNAAHSYPAPAVLSGLGLATGSSGLVALALVWFAHIGMDRALGYGLKYGTGFAYTHLGRIGRRAR